MALAAYQPFFAASMAATAALLGLLFVAVSVAPERTVGSRAPVERQVVAESVFTALINAFFVSMAGTLPDLNLGNVALPLSAFALFQTLHAAWKLWPPKFTTRTVIKRLGLVLVALVIYGVQFRDASQLLHMPDQSASVGSEIILLFALYAFALGRSWELLGARRGILSGRLSPAIPGADESAEAVPSRPTPVLADPHSRPHQGRRSLRSEGMTSRRARRPPSGGKAGRPAQTPADASGP